MSIVTKSGDQGTTGLMYNRRVSKCHPRVEAYGAVDELNAAIGLARAGAEDEFVRESLAAIQKDLVRLMGELATAVEDLPRYVKDGHEPVASGMTNRLESWLGKSRRPRSPPGAGRPRCERGFGGARCGAHRLPPGGKARLRAQDAGQLQNTEIVVYLNRLSDLLWLFARWVEAKRG